MVVVGSGGNYGSRVGSGGSSNKVDGTCSDNGGCSVVGGRTCVVL